MEQVNVLYPKDLYAKILHIVAIFSYNIAV